MKQINKAIAVVLAVLILALPANALSSENIEETDRNISFLQAYALTESINLSEEISKACNGVTDPLVSEDVLAQISTGSFDENVDVHYTVKFLGNISGNELSRGTTTGNVYSVTATTKTTMDTYEEGELFAWISMTWIDNLGIDNQIVRVQGGWATGGYEVLDRQVWYGVKGVSTTFEGDLYETQFPETNSFNYEPSKNLVGLTLKAYSFCDLHGRYSLYVNVTPTIFD